MLALHRVWIDNEVLYREGLKLPLGADQAKNREQVIFKALSAIDENVRPATVDDEELRRWYESRRDRYAEPARFDFEDAMLAGASSEATVKTLVEQLNSGAPVPAKVSVRAFKGRPESNLVQSYGEGVAGALVKARPGTWLALRARDGWRAMRLLTHVPASAASFDTRRDKIHRDWLDATVTERRNAAVRALWKKYKIEFAEKHECLADK